MCTGGDQRPFLSRWAFQDVRLKVRSRQPENAKLSYVLEHLNET
jgi:hypothetical protein